MSGAVSGDRALAPGPRGRRDHGALLRADARGPEPLREEPLGGSVRGPATETARLGEQRPQLRITKAGDRLLRSLLVRCAHYILGPFGPDTDLRRAGLRMAERGGSASKKRAIVAVARRLAVLLHRLWVTGELYEPLRCEASKAA